MMKLRTILAIAFLLPFFSACTSEKIGENNTNGAGARGTTASGTIPEPGVDYFETDTLPFQPGTGKIEVAELFGYTCNHCADLQPIVKDWRRHLPDDVNYIHVPGAFGGYWDPFARAYFTAEELGVLEQTHDGMFEAIRQRRFNNAELSTFVKIYSEMGVDADAFITTYNGPRVEAKLKRARQFAEQTKVDGTPTIIVNGKYTVPTSRRGFNGMLETVAWLVEKERNEAAQ